ncbi:MAG: response regulator transcription factor [Planctomycetota bacterium]
MARTTILLIEDDPDIVEIVRFNLEREGFHVLSAEAGDAGLQLALEHRPELVVLDLMLPGMGGLEVCRKLRESDRTLGASILMLTAKDEESDVVIGLEMGADDYLAKPFRPRELVARIRALLRRGERNDAPERGKRLQRDDVTLDATRHEVLVAGESVEFTRAEFRLLWALCERPGRVYTRGELVDRITDGEVIITERNVDVHISAVRKKLGDSGDLIATVRGVGYKCRD